MNNVAGEAGAMPLLPLSEAAAQCARETGEQVTSDWLLQFAGKGQLKISFIARTVIPLEGTDAGTSVIYNIGDYINLPAEWASWMHGSKEKPRTVELSLLSTPSGPRYIKDAMTGKRVTIEVREEDLCVSFEEITSLVSTLFERRKKANEEREVLHQQLERQVEEKRKAGRYTLAEAALCIASSAGERKEVIEKKLARAVETLQLPAYEPGRRAKMEYTIPKESGGFIGSDLRMKFTPPTGVRTFYEEIYWDDLNNWLAENEPRIFYRFPPPDLIPLSAALSTLSARFGVTAGELAMWVCIDHTLPAWSTINDRVEQRFQNADLERLLTEYDSIDDALIALDKLNVQVSTSMVAEFNADSMNRYWDYKTAQKFIQDTVNNVDVEKKILKRWQRTHDNLRSVARTNGQLQIAAYVPGIGFAKSIEKGLVIESEFKAFLGQVSRLVGTTTTHATPTKAQEPKNHKTRIEPQGGDSLTPTIWTICYDLKDAGKRITARTVMAELKIRADAKLHPLIGTTAGGVKYEYEKGDERELNSELLRKRIDGWKGKTGG